MYDPVSVATFYAALFPARTDAYSRWIGGNPPVGWRPVREELTAEVILAGLGRTGPAISGFMIAPGNVGHTLAVDFDTEDGLAQGFALAARMAKAGLPAYVETSRRGSHLWAVLDRQVEARTMRKALRALLQAALLPTDDPHIEIRPGSDSINKDGLGHALRLPLMPHPKTGERPRFMDATGKVLGPTVAAILLDIEQGDAEIVERWARRWRPALQVTKEHYGPMMPFPEDTSTASEILRTMWGAERAMAGRSIRCPAHDDHMPTLSILKDDRRAICKSPTCVLNNNDRGRGTYELRKLAPNG